MNFYYLEPHQNKKLSDIFYPKEYNFDPIYDIKINGFGFPNYNKKGIKLYKDYDRHFNFHPRYNSSEDKETKSGDFDYKRYYISSAKAESQNCIKRKRERSKSRKAFEKKEEKEPIYAINMTNIKRPFFISKAPTKKELFKVEGHDIKNINLNKNQNIKKEEIEFSKTSIGQKVTNISSKSMSLNANQILSILAKVNPKIIDFLIKVHNDLEDKCSKDGQNEININDFKEALQKKTLHDILIKFDPNECEEANELLKILYGIISLKYYFQKNYQLSKN